VKVDLLGTIVLCAVVGEEAVGVAEEAEETGQKGRNVPGGGKPGKKRKIAVLLAYCGAGYQGMQRNPGAITIEGELEQALFRANAIAECNFGDLRKVDWMRAARTDKGVSAVGQVVSARLVIDPPGFVERVNEHLPKEIRVFGYTRVTSNFSAKQMCDKRRYEYIIPIFAFDPHAHHDRETILAWTEKRDNARLQRIERRKALEKKDAGGESEVVFDTSGSNNGTIALNPETPEPKTLSIVVSL
jgi:tRNA pseudouridine38-40 synthase